MKRLSFLITFLFIFNLNLFAFEIGSTWAQRVQEAFEKGHYEDFIGQMESRYLRGLINQDWDGLLSEQEKSQDVQSPQEKEKYQKLLKNSLNYKKELDVLLKDRNKELMSIAKRYPDTFVSKVIRDIQPVPSSEFSEEVSEKVDDVVDPSEEIHFKASVFSSLLAMTAMNDYDEWLNLGKITPEEREKLYFVLGLYEFKQLLQINNKPFEKVEIEQECKAYATMVANQHNEHYLQKLALGQKEPENRAEALAAEIVKRARDQQISLIHKFQLNR